MKLNEFKKKQEKQGLYRLFVVCWQTAKSFAISQQTAKLPRGSYLCNLGALGWPIWLLCRLLADDKDLCIFVVYQQTA